MAGLACSDALETWEGQPSRFRPRMWKLAAPPIVARPNALPIYTRGWRAGRAFRRPAIPPLLARPARPTGCSRISRRESRRNMVRTGRTGRRTFRIRPAPVPGPGPSFMASEKPGPLTCPLWPCAATCAEALRRRRCRNRGACRTLPIRHKDNRRLIPVAFPDRAASMTCEDRPI